MKKLFALVLAALLIVGMLPMTAMAEDAPAGFEVRLYSQGTDPITTFFTPGMVTYATSDDSQNYVAWTDTANAPTDKFVKMELSADGTTLNVTLNNLDILNTQPSYTKGCLMFKAGDYAVNITVIGDNKLSSGNSPCIKAENSNGITITGDGKLTLFNNNCAAACLWSVSKELIIKNTTLDATMTPGNTSLFHAILADTGDITIEGSKVTTTTEGGSGVFFGLLNKETNKRDKDTDESRKLLIKDSEFHAVGLNKGNLFVSPSPATITNSTLTAKGGKAFLFSPAPNLEGEHTALAGLAKNANKPEKLKAYDDSKLSSYTYISVVPYIIETTAPETEAPTTEATQPVETTAATQPTTQPATQPVETTAATQPTTQPVETTAATQPTDTDKDNDTAEKKPVDPWSIILIVLGVLIVAGAAAVAVLFLRNKNAAAADELNADEEAEEEAEETDANADEEAEQE